VNEEGQKELIGIHDGIRESTLSWKEFLQNLKSRGMNVTPSLAIGDGALGFWSPIEEEQIFVIMLSYSSMITNMCLKISLGAFVYRGFAKPCEQIRFLPTRISCLSILDQELGICLDEVVFKYDLFEGAESLMQVVSIHQNAERHLLREVGLKGKFLLCDLVPIG